MKLIHATAMKRFKYLEYIRKDDRDILKHSAFIEDKRERRKHRVT